MLVTRMYTGDDDRTHFEELDIPMEDTPLGLMSGMLPVEAVQFREIPEAMTLDFHPAPRRQFVLTLTGAVEIETGAGEKRRFGPGDVLLADDTDGEGHMSRDLESPRTQIFLHLGSDIDIERWRN